MVRLVCQFSLAIAINCFGVLHGAYPAGWAGLCLRLQCCERHVCAQIVHDSCEVLYTPVIGVQGARCFGACVSHGCPNKMPS